MAFDVNNPYFRTRVLTATPEELRLMLIEGCVTFLKQGRDALAERAWEKMHENFNNARNILVELMSTMKHEIAPEVCGNLEAIYSYVFRRLTEGSFEKDIAKVDEAIRLMEYDQQTWVLLMDKLAEERAGQSSPAQAIEAPAVPQPRATTGAARYAAAAASSYQPLSIQG